MMWTGRDFSEHERFKLHFSFSFLFNSYRALVHREKEKHYLITQFAACSTTRQQQQAQARQNLVKTLFSFRLVKETVALFSESHWTAKHRESCLRAALFFLSLSFRLCVESMLARPGSLTPQKCARSRSCEESVVDMLRAIRCCRWLWETRISALEAQWACDEVWMKSSLTVIGLGLTVSDTTASNLKRLYRSWQWVREQCVIEEK